MTYWPLANQTAADFKALLDELTEITGRVARKAADEPKRPSRYVIG